jgi:hypothetical protein
LPHGSPSVGVKFFRIFGLNVWIFVTPSKVLHVHSQRKSIHVERSPEIHTHRKFFEYLHKYPGSILNRSIQSMNEIQQKHTKSNEKCTKSPQIRALQAKIQQIRALQAKVHQDPADPNSSKWPGMTVVVGDGCGCRSSSTAVVVGDGGAVVVADGGAVELEDGGHPGGARRSQRVDLDAAVRVALDAAGGQTSRLPAGGARGRRIWWSRRATARRGVGEGAGGLGFLG